MTEEEKGEAARVVRALLVPALERDSPDGALARVIIGYIFEVAGYWSRNDGPTPIDFVQPLLDVALVSVERGRRAGRPMNVVELPVTSAS